MDKEQIIETAKYIRKKYVVAELKHYRDTNEKSKSLRAKVSVMTEFLNEIYGSDEWNKNPLKGLS